MLEWRVRGSAVSIYFWYDLMTMIKNLHKEEESLDLTILPGIHRSGTTVLFQCLQATEGFQEKHPLRLVGEPPCEHALWRIANYHVSKFLGANAFTPGSARDHTIGDFLVGNIDNSKPLSDDIKLEMNDMIGIFVWQNIKLLKEPTCQLALQAWIDNFKCFKNAKYIWTRRDYREAAKSLVRLKVPNRLDLTDECIKKSGYRGKLKVGNAERMSRYWDSVLEGIMPQVNHIEIWHHDLIHDTEKTFDRISEFIGRGINTEPFNAGKVWGNCSGATESRSKD